VSRFAGLKDQAARKVAPADVATAPTTSGTAKAREGKKMIGGYFSDKLSREIRAVALAEDTTVQALVGEGLDMLLRDRGKHPLGER